MPLTTLALATALASSSGWAPSCVTDRSEFDFMSTSPTTFSSGSRKDVSEAYRKLVEEIGDPANYEKPTLFFVSRDFTHFTQKECAADQCRGLEILTGIQQCAAESESGGEACLPIAAVHQSRAYCLLEPSLDEFDADDPFHPFG